MAALRFDLLLHWPEVGYKSILLLLKKKARVIILEIGHSLDGRISYAPYRPDHSAHHVNDVVSESESPTVGRLGVFIAS